MECEHYRLRHSPLASLMLPTLSLFVVGERVWHTSTAISTLVLATPCTGCSDMRIYDVTGVSKCLHGIFHCQVRKYTSYLLHLHGV